ncbi:hypothetical protein BDA96_08G119400 [Sorghum bicolor]|uniref:Calmodulin-binding domain-containing protein n=1 Tax=Sorghum bicolor TaxID=4558 RepID=A0A921QHE1_SORBI|nr:hypothetical protein BDA96_08G119400 [Sorghum bicolor]
MEVQMAAQGPKPTGRGSTPSPSDSHHGGGATAKPVPGYLRPSAGSCHHVCKYGGTHTFEDHKEAHSRPQQPRPPRKQPPPPAPAPAPAESHNHSRVLVKVRSVFRRRVGDSTTTATTQKPSKAAAAGKAKAAKEGVSVEWKDIVAYDTVPLPSHGSSSPGPELGKTSAAHHVTAGSGDAAKKKAVVKKGKKSYGKAKVHEQVHGDRVVQAPQNEPLGTVTNANTDSKSARPPKTKNKPAAALLVENMGIDQETLQGYQILSPSLAQSRANLLRDLEKEMMVHQEPANVKQDRTTTVTYSLDPEEYAAAESSRPMPIPAHRRVQSMSISSRSVRQPFARQASKNSVSFKLRSRSTRAAAPAVVPPEEEEKKKPARLRSRRGEDASSAATGRGIHLRIRSLRRRGVGGGSGGAGTGGGFVVPAVALRHQKTLEKKRSQRLYNSHIEETAGKLVKTRKSRVKALVGAFESVISKIAK